MIYNIDEIKSAVRLSVNQNSTSNAFDLIADTETLNLDKLIEGKIEEAARLVTLGAPYNLLDEGKDFANSVYWFSGRGYGGGFLELPEDFLRLSVFQMSDWSRPVFTPISEDSPEYAMQSSRFPGIRGCPQKPVAALVMHPVGLVLEFYSCSSGESAIVKKARYIPVPKIKEGNIELCEKLKPAIVLYTAGLVAAYIQDKELAELLFTQSKELMK